jgi:hypothetical protein
MGIFGGKKFNDANEGFYSMVDDGNPRHSMHYLNFALTKANLSRFQIPLPMEDQW